MTGVPSLPGPDSTPVDGVPGPADRSASARPVRARRPRCAVAAVLTALLAVALAGCGNNSNRESVNPEEQLRSRPSFEQASVDYLAMLDEIRQAISGKVPTLHWQTAKSAQDGSSMCEEPFTKIPGADRANYKAGTGKGGIPETDWPRVVQAVTEIAKKHGFPIVVPLVSTTGRHVLDIHGPWGATLELGSEVNATLSIIGARFLHENARSGAPTPMAIP